MECSMAALLDKFLSLLREHANECLNLSGRWSDANSIVRSIKFVKTVRFHYNAYLSGVDEAHELASLFDDTRMYLGWLEHQISVVPTCDDPLDISSALSDCFWTITFLRNNVRGIYAELTKVPHSHLGLFADDLMFDEFAGTVEKYLMDVPKEPVGWGDSPHFYSEVEANYKVTVQKLKRFRELVSRFSEQCTDEKKLRSLLAGATSVLLYILDLACTNDVQETYGGEMEENIVSSSSQMSRKLSPHNPDIMEPYLENLSGTVEILKASKQSPSGGPVHSMSESFLNLLQSAHYQVKILGEILDFGLMDLTLCKPGDVNGSVEILLKQGYVAVAREAASLCCSLPNHVVLFKLVHELNFIKDEIFIQELQNHKASLTVNPAAAIGEAFRFLSQCFKAPVIQMGDKEKQVLQRIEAFVRETGSLCDSRNSEDMILESCVSIFKLFKAETMLMVVINNTASLTFLAEIPIETLHKSLIIVRELFSAAPRDNDKDGNLSAIYGTLERMIRPTQVNILPSPRKNFEEIMAVYVRGLWYLFKNFPRSDGLVFAEHLLQRMTRLVTNMPEAFMKTQFQALLGQLDLIVTFLREFQVEHGKNQDILLRVTCFVYMVEYIIDMLIIGDGPVLYHQMVLFIAIEEINFIKARILDYRPPSEDSFESRVQDEVSNLGREEVIVGFDDKAKIVMDQLITGSSNLQVVSIVGMAGIGKTTLANKVYGHASIRRHFHVHARCSLSQSYRKREVLLEIVSQLESIAYGEMEKMDDDDLAMMVRRSLKGKRYLILFDDVWSVQNWTDLQDCFPDDRNSSRIVITTRLYEVAIKANPRREPFVLSLLSPLESWTLLQQELFWGETCPPELWEVGKRIAEFCGGLPLAVVNIAEVLKTTGMRKEEWECIAEQFASRTADDEESKSMNIVELSYNHLPSYLKPCFLYLGLFLEDQEIPVKKLQWLWISEGFIPQVDSKSLEETARDFLVALMNRSFVMEDKRRSLGGTKTIRIHDMLRMFCLKKAKEENFMELMSMNGSDTSVGMQYRLCVHSAKQNLIRLRPSASHVHSLLLFATDSAQDRNLYDVSSIFRYFKLVRVLDLEHLAASIFPRGTDSLLGLSYLAIKGNIKSVPSSISKLRNLETLIVKGTRGEIALPSILWSMDTLRHVHVRPRASLTISSPELENPMVLDNLTSFSAPVFSHSRERGEAENIVRRLLGLQKLMCILMGGTRVSDVLPAMEFLTKLESLNISCIGKTFSSEFSFPPNLKKLTLSRFRFPWDFMYAISELPKLEALKLLFRAVEGDTWDMAEKIKFPRLKYLKLENLDLVNWMSSSGCPDNFPELERLVLKSCERIEEVPLCFEEVATLQMIEVHMCSESAVKSVLRILEEQREFGNPDFQVIITPPELDFRRSNKFTLKKMIDSGS